MKRRRSFIYTPNQTYFITSTVTGFIKIFHIPEFADILLNNFKFYQNQYKIKIHAYVIMPNHFHILLTMGEREIVSKFIGKSKEYTTKEVVKRLKEERYDKYLNLFLNSAVKYKLPYEYQLWQQRFDDVVIYSDKQVKIKLEYIHNNPVKAGLAENQEDWKFSSARYYLMGKDCGVDISTV